ncbi:MAG: serine--tRNA ligase [Puniceicoccales bacterium]|jgi:seryl-tRNA synthetase|nr:serine--tRNA ligase [Puniceicoccales bacterium]
MYKFHGTMLDLKFLRENSDFVKAGVANKKFNVDIDAFLNIDGERRKAISEYEQLRAEQKQASDKMAQMDKSSTEFSANIGALKQLSARVKELELRVNELNFAWNEAYLAIPNIPHASVPIGKSDKDNVELMISGDMDSVSPHAVPHYDIPWFSQAIDFSRGAKVSGAGFPFYIGSMSRLVRALVAFFLDEARSNGYTEFSTPILVNEASATATGQLPDKESQMYHDAQDNLYCIPTAEVPVTNFFRGEILSEEDLPIYRCAYTPCFRREAGSWGRDVRGLNRLHQFDKVELVKWCHPDRSFEELEKLRADAEGILKKLELPYRVLLICTGDIGFAHAKQYDLEVWAGGQKRWLEVSSCSNFTDFQARRGDIKFRKKSDSKTQHVHTLNGSGLAVPRVLAAILENNLQGDGKVKLPEILIPYMGGVAYLEY